MGRVEEKHYGTLGPETMGRPLPKKERVENTQDSESDLYGEWCLTGAEAMGRGHSKPAATKQRRS